MADSISNWTAVLIFLFTFLILLFLTKRRKGMPPGPFAVPVIGNLLHLAGSDPLQNLRDLHNKYGGMYSLSIGQSVYIVLSGYDVIHDALVKKGAHFSNRPNTLFSKKLMGRGIIFGNANVWKGNRKLAQHGLQTYRFSETAAPLESRIQAEIALVIGIIQKTKGPFDLGDFLCKAFADVIASVCFGERWDYEDPSFNYYVQCLDIGSEIIARSTLLMDCFPFLQYMPGDILKINLIKQMRKRNTKFKNTFIDKHRTSFKPVNIRDFIDLYLTEIESDTTGNRNIKELGAIMDDLYGAGSESLTTTIRWLILYLLNNPHIQQKLHHDIDVFIGSERKPCLQDRNKLPYVEAAILETLRIAAPTPLTPPHTAKEDIMFRGYLIPQNTTIFINLDAAMNDPKIWNDPRVFRPERFLDIDGNLSIPKEFIPFSVGRRSCIGESLARMELFLFTTSLLQKFEFVCPQGTSPPKPMGRLGLIHSPVPYLVEALPRTG